MKEHDFCDYNAQCDNPCICAKCRKDCHECCMSHGKDCHGSCIDFEPEEDDE